MIECQAYMYKENDSPVSCKINFLFIAVYYLLLKFDPQNGLVSIKQGIAFEYMNLLLLPNTGLDSKV
jgi:hypothetical protein